MRGSFTPELPRRHSADGDVFAPRPWLSVWRLRNSAGRHRVRHRPPRGFAEQPGSGGASGIRRRCRVARGRRRQARTRLGNHRSRRRALGVAAHAGQSGPPSGPVVVTLLNGVTDFRRGSGSASRQSTRGKPAPLSGDPITPPGGIEYARSATVTSVSGALLGTDDLLPFVVAARGADVVSGVDCRQILARSRRPRRLDDSTRASESGSAPEAGRRRVGTRRSEPPRCDHSAGRRQAAAARRRRPVQSPFRPLPTFASPSCHVIPAAAFLEARSFLLALGGCAGRPRRHRSVGKIGVRRAVHAEHADALGGHPQAAPRRSTKDHVGLSFLGRHAGGQVDHHGPDLLAQAGA